MSAIREIKYMQELHHENITEVYEMESMILTCEVDRYIPIEE
jgi:hypothetical protein